MLLFGKEYRVEDLVMCKIREHYSTEFIITTVKSYNKNKGYIGCKIKSLDGRKFEDYEVLEAQPLYYVWNDEMQTLLNKHHGRVDRAVALELQQILNKRYC